MTRQELVQKFEAYLMNGDPLAEINGIPDDPDEVATLVTSLLDDQGDFYMVAAVVPAEAHRLAELIVDRGLWGDVLTAGQ